MEGKEKWETYTEIPIGHGRSRDHDQRRILFKMSETRAVSRASNLKYNIIHLDT